MALTALSKGQLLIGIYKMYKENNMQELYDKKFLQYSIEELASEYIYIENILKKRENLELKRDFINKMITIKNQSKLKS